MKRAGMRLPLVGLILATLAAAAIAADANAPVGQDQQRLKGSWRVVSVEVNGQVTSGEALEQLSVVNGDDGTWALKSDSRTIAEGTSTINPSVTPKTIDFTVTKGDGNGNQHLGIYELGDNTRKLCFAPQGQSRPLEFVSAPGSQHVLVHLERMPGSSK